MDTYISAKQRAKTLKYIEENFEVVHGNIQYNKTTALCIARKKI